MQVHQLMDACLFAVSFWLAYKLRVSPAVASLLNLQPVNTPFEPYVWLYLFLLPVAPLVLESQGFYSAPVACSRRLGLWRLLKSCLLMSLALVIGLFLSRTPLARGVVLWFACLSFGLVWAKEELVRWKLRGRMAHSQFRRRFLLVGAGEEAERIAEQLKGQSQEAIEVVGQLNLDQAEVGELVFLLHKHSVNAVVLSARHTHFEQVNAALQICEREGVEAWLVADFFRTQISRTTFDDFYGRPVLVFRSVPEASWESVLKQLLDFFGALLLLLLLALPLAVVAVLVKLTSPGPIFFRQHRSGLNGHPFTLYKFRTMVTNAEQLKHELAAMNEMTGPVFKVTNDPRITPMGRLLRKFSIDEFPQLWNVLRGEMSLVGPRPLPVDEVRRFNDLAHRRRLSVKPGLTCLWQISGRNNVKDFRDWVRLDLEYIDNWSFWLDLKILWRTVPVVLTGAGAK